MNIDNDRLERDTESKENEKLKLLKWFLPDLIPEEIEYYKKVYNGLTVNNFLNKVFEIQKTKNNNIIEDIRSYLKYDENINNIIDQKSELSKIIPNMFLGRNIKEFLKNHATNLVLEGLPVLVGVRLPLEGLDSNLITYNPDGVYYNNTIFVHLHKFFESIPGFRFDYLQIYNKYIFKGVSFMINLDWNNSVLLENYRRIGREEGLYYGKPYEDNLLFLKGYKHEFTKMYREEDNKEIIGNQINFTEFLIDEKNHSIQIEEISDLEYDGSIFLHRYIHGEIDIENKVIKHLDGAVILYDKINHEKRKATDLRKPDCKTFGYQKTKMFKIDNGVLEIGDFKKIVISFFAGNEMVLEYLDIQEYLKEKKAGGFGFSLKNYDKEEEKFSLNYYQYPEKYELCEISYYVFLNKPQRGISNPPL